MRTITFFVMVFLMTFIVSEVTAQATYQERISNLQARKEKITEQEKEALKEEVADINERLSANRLSEQEAKVLKEDAAKKRAMNIENRIAIVDNEIALLTRNEGKVLTVTEQDTTDFAMRLGIDFLGREGSEFIWNNRRYWKREFKYDRKTYSDFVLGFGLNNALIDGQSMTDTPYKVAGSRFVELGWAWRTRVFPNSNFMRLSYGFSFQFNGLKPKDNQYFEMVDGTAELREFEFELKKSKFRRDNLVFPVHFEFGPSMVNKSEEKIRYSIDRKFRLGLGGYGGINLGTRQKLKYDRDGERVKDKLRRGYNTNDFIYGLSGYVGFGGALLYAKYDLNPIFKDAVVDQHNISLGLRFDL
tara:strand:+ start:2320 stop:3396 length:1077 start_codon:yes stop_codon:yes gene_type:complete